MSVFLERSVRMIENCLLPSDISGHKHGNVAIPLFICVAFEFYVHRCTSSTKTSVDAKCV
jgi:hypothetical protein